jgi:hypothetical protein
MHLFDVSASIGRGLGRDDHVVSDLDLLAHRLVSPLARQGCFLSSLRGLPPFSGFP